MGFNDWIYVEPVPMAHEGREEEIDLLMKERLATDIQRNLRGRVDPGVDLKSALQAQSVRVRSSGGQIIIDEHDQAAVLTGGQSNIPGAPASQGIESLFKLGTGIPTIETGAGGERRLAFRTVDAKKMFTEMAEAGRDTMVEGTVEESLRMNMVDAFEESFDTVRRRYPSEDK